MLYEKVFHVNKKKVDAAQKNILCRQKQDDAASKKYFVHKKVVIFFRNGAWMNFLCIYFLFTWSNCGVTQSSSNALILTNFETLF